MKKVLHHRTFWIVPLLASGLIVYFVALASGSKLPEVELQFKGFTNSVTSGRVAVFAFINRDRRAVQRLPLYVVERRDDPERQVITVAVPPILKSESSEIIDVPIPKTSGPWRLGASCSLTGFRRRTRDRLDASRQIGRTPGSFLPAYRIKVRVLEILAHEFPANYVYVQSEWIDTSHGP